MPEKEKLVAIREDKQVPSENNCGSCDDNECDTCPENENEENYDENLNKIPVTKITKKNFCLNVSGGQFDLRSFNDKKDATEYFNVVDKMIKQNELEKNIVFRISVEEDGGIILRYGNLMF